MTGKPSFNQGLMQLGTHATLYTMLVNELLVVTPDEVKLAKENKYNLDFSGMNWIQMKRFLPELYLFNKHLDSFAAFQVKPVIDMQSMIIAEKEMKAANIYTGPYVFPLINLISLLFLT